jgi:hypothetical protein
VLRSSSCSLSEICGRTSNKITRWPSQVTTPRSTQGTHTPRQWTQLPYLKTGGSVQWLPDFLSSACPVALTRVNELFVQWLSSGFVHWPHSAGVQWFVQWFMGCCLLPKRPVCHAHFKPPTPTRPQSGTYSLCLHRGDRRRRTERDLRSRWQGLVLHRRVAERLLQPVGYPARVDLRASRTRNQDLRLSDGS